ncbi:glycoside hydrolase family 97 protein [Shewanella sp. KX20019]|uniref:glycoside hydrolase family 97 protein n=1 Tax=Shewanella sp. KX20019 TaxID=2803864 RepID=UPI001926AFE2|nr:glycoside hydrolase family 97 protein [Shewanella sp. KX20019]QQX82288.1 glycoside hydrolase family 97 protein [Shewanella sp. KX20019]
MTTRQPSSKTQYKRSPLCKRSKSAIITALFVSTLTSYATLAKTVSVTSPDKNIVITLSDDNGQPEYSVQFQGQEVITPSRLGLVFKSLGEFGQGFKIEQSKHSSIENRWQQPWGEQEWIKDNYHQITTTLSNGKYQFKLHFKAFNDGLGFRYEIPKQAKLDQLTITNELTEFSVPKAEKAQAWWIPARGWNRYEYLYSNSTLDKVTNVHTPFTFKLASGVHMSIHEAALVDYAAMTLNQRRTGKLKADLTPWSDGSLVKTRAGFKTPWRTIQISAEAIGLLNSNLILNLNEPNKLGDVSWVEPGKYVGIWWGMHLNENTWGSGNKHGATTSETKRYMDFAANNGFDGVLVEGWNIGWDGSWFHNGDVFSFTQTYADFDLKAVSEYGSKKGVKLIGHHETSGSVSNYRNQMEDAYDLYQKHGVSQVKTGYVADGGDIKRIDDNGIIRHEWHDGQFMANEYLHSVKEAAKRHISINTHEPIKDTGLRRTYPNWIAREGARGQEFNAWGTPPNNPSHTTTLAYTRMLSGPMDFTPGIFNLAPEGLDAINRVQTTLTKQLALYVVLYSPIQMAADLPRNYVERLDAFQFIKDVPTDWSNSVAIAGDIGEFVVLARQERNSSNQAKDWYLGAITDDNTRDIEIKLDFLTKGIRYQAQIYRDGKDANWRSNPYDYVIETKVVSRDESLILSLASSGGTAIRFKALD